MAANKRPIRGMLEVSLINMICCRSKELQFNKNHVIIRINPISPIRLYSIAWRAAVLASARPYHHPISRNDIMPTPSQPINNWSRLLAVTRINIVDKKMSRYLKNLWIFGSELMYHIENSKIDQVTNKAVGRNRIEK